MARHLVRGVIGEVEDVEIRQSTVDDDAAPALLAAAQDAELLVVGSRGHGGFAGLLLGSVSQQCAESNASRACLERDRVRAEPTGVRQAGNTGQLAWKWALVPRGFDVCGDVLL